MKRVLVTGGSGFIGANLVRRLLTDGHEVHLWLRPESAGWRRLGIANQVCSHLVDLGDAEEVEVRLRAISPDWIFHLAAHGAYSFQTDVPAMVRSNYVATTNLVQASVKVGVGTFLHTGSSSEYGFKNHAPLESEPAEPNSDYAATKAAATAYCQYAGRRHRQPILTVRLYSVYGPYEDPRRLMPTLVRHAREGRWPPLVGPDISRDFIYVDDVCDALLALAAHPPTDPGAIYNLGSGVQTTMRELTEVAANLFGIMAPPEWNSMPNRAWDTAVWVSNPGKIKRELGWRPKTHLLSGLRLMSQWAA